MRKNIRYPGTEILSNGILQTIVDKSPLRSGMQSIDYGKIIRRYCARPYWAAAVKIFWC